jgi:hypothetical protein
MLNTAADNAMTRVENRSGMEDYFIAILEGLSLANGHFETILLYYRINCHLGSILSFAYLCKLTFWKDYLSYDNLHIVILERFSL